MDLEGHVDEVSRSVIHGWVIDQERPDATIALSILVNGVHRGMCLTTHARDDLVLPNGDRLTGKHGFHHEFEPPLSPFVELRIEVIETWSGQVLRNGSRILPRPQSHDGNASGVIPVLLTSTGRTGTTLLMSEFARHPDLVVGDQFPYEIKQIAYHAAAFRALVADADWERSTRPETMLAPTMRNIIGSNPYKMSGLFGLGGPKTALRGFYHSEMPNGYATLFRQFITDFYATLATAQGKAAAPYFCEKGDLDEAAVQGARLFFDRVKDIVIVRDPRDLLCSAIAFWKLRPDAALKMLASTVSRLAWLARHAGPDTIVIRYEDLVREPVPTRQALSRFLDLDLSPPITQAEPIPDSHRTSSDPASSIGRWRNDLAPQQIEACEAAFGAVLRDFDYELSASAGRRDRRKSQRDRTLVAEGVLNLAVFNESYATESEDGSTSRRALELIFGSDGSGEIFIREGWARAEKGFIWSNAPESHLLLPPIRGKGKFRLHIVASPFTHGTTLPAQRISVLINDHAAGSAQAHATCVLSVPVPAVVARSGRAIKLTLCFPDAARPSEVVGIDDTRLLGFSLHRIALFQTELMPPEAAAGKPALRPGGSAVPESKANPQSRTRGNTGALTVDRLAELTREAFRLPLYNYHGRTVLRTIAGYDTAGFVRFVLALEAGFGITLHEDEVDRIETMGDVLALLRARLVADARSSARETAN